MDLNTVVTVGLGATIAVLGIATFSYISLSARERKRRRYELVTKPRKTPVTEALFFPIDNFFCKKFFLGNDCPYGDKCKYMHKSNSVWTMAQHIRATTETLDVCMFTISTRDLTSAILSAMENNGAKLRLLINNNMYRNEPGQVDALREAGGQVVTVPSNPKSLHHKFAILDRSLVITGSYNWTAQASTGNFDNVILSSNSMLVGPFIEEFNKLWRQFNNEPEEVPQPTLLDKPITKAFMSVCDNLNLRKLLSIKEDQPKFPDDEVLFFPDKHIPCKNYFSRVKCLQTDCNLLHENSSVMRIVELIHKARVCINLCLYTLSHPELQEALIYACKRKLKIQMLIDKNMCKSDRNMLTRLGQYGVDITEAETRYLFHHKFAIIDNQCVINGSLNWSAQAPVTSYENVIVTWDPKLVNAFNEEFEKSWKLFNGDHSLMAGRRPAFDVNLGFRSSAWDSIIVGHETPNVPF